MELSKRKKRYRNEENGIIIKFSSFTIDKNMRGGGVEEVGVAIFKALFIVECEVQTLTNFILRGF